MPLKQKTGIGIVPMSALQNIYSELRIHLDLEYFKYYIKKTFWQNVTSLS